MKHISWFPPFSFSSLKRVFRETKNSCVSVSSIHFYHRSVSLYCISVFIHYSSAKTEQYTNVLHFMLLSFKRNLCKSFCFEAFILSYVGCYSDLSFPIIFPRHWTPAFHKDMISCRNKCLMHLSVACGFNMTLINVIETETKGVSSMTTSLCLCLCDSLWFSITHSLTHIRTKQKSYWERSVSYYREDRMHPIQLLKFADYHTLTI